MSKLLKALPLLGLTFFVSGFFFVGGATVHAQTATPGSSIDIASLDGNGQTAALKSCIIKVLPSISSAQVPNDVMNAYHKYALDFNLFDPASYANKVGGGFVSTSCTSSYPTNKKNYAVECGVTLITRVALTGGDVTCTITAPDNSYLTTTGNFYDGYQFTKYDAAGKETGNANAGAGVSASAEGEGATGTQTGQGAEVPGTGGGECSFSGGSFSGCLLGILASIIAKIASFILLIVAGILYLANYLLGWSTYVTVYQFGNLIGNSAGLLAAWAVLRDVANIILLFGFIFMGISTILNLSHSEYTAKRALPTLIIFALLLNFSLLAAEAMIDVSNAVAVSIYNQAGGCGSGSDLSCITDKGIGGTVMQLSGVGSAFSNSWANGIDSATTDLVIIVGLTIFLLITAIVLFAAAIMLIIRAVMLGLLMVTSPVGFAGMAIPPLHGVAKMWWKQLISQAIFAPIYFLIAFVSLKMMEGIVTALGTSGKTSEQNLAAVFSSSVVKDGTSSNISVGITFALLIGFMVAALMFAKRSSAFGTSFALKSAGRIGGGLAFGTTGFLARNTVGRVAYGVGRNIQNSKSGFGATRLGQFTAKKFQGVGKASFDARATGATAGLAGLTGSLGTANKGGYAGAVHEREEAQKKYAKDFERNQKEKDELAEIDGVGGRGGKIREAAAENAALEKENAEVLEGARAASETALEPERNQIDAQKIELESAKEMAAKLKANASEAQTAGNTGRATALLEKAKKADEQVTALQDALTGAEDDYRKKTEANLQGITSKIENDKQNYEKLMEGLTKRKKELLAAPDERRRAYAEELHTPGVLGVGAKNAGDHHAAEAIFKELAKSPEDKRADRIVEALKERAKDERSNDRDGDSKPKSSDDH